MPEGHEVTWAQVPPMPCAICRLPIARSAAFIDTGPTDRLHNPEAPRKSRYIPEGTDIHGWSPFETSHPACFAKVHGEDQLAQLMAYADELSRRINEADLRRQE